MYCVIVLNGNGFLAIVRWEKIFNNFDWLSGGVNGDSKDSRFMWIFWCFYNKRVYDSFGFKKDSMTASV